MDSARNRRLEQVDAEQLLGALAGVVSAHVVTAANGDLVEIHILARPDLHPKQVVRNVESALSAGLGIQVDRRIVSVAQIRAPEDETAAPSGAGGQAAALSLLQESDDGARATPAGAPDDRAAAAPAPAAAPRLEYVRYEARRDAERCECTVVLRSADAEILGRGVGPDTAPGRAEAAARAVFDAIGQARPELELVLEGVTLSPSRGRNFVIVSAHAVLDRSSIPLAGAARLARSPEEGAILAALQASNRWSG